MGVIKTPYGYVIKTNKNSQYSYLSMSYKRKHGSNKVSYNTEMYHTVSKKGEQIKNTKLKILSSHYLRILNIYSVPTHVFSNVKNPISYRGKHTYS